MATTFPVSLAGFADLLDIVEGDFKLNDNRRFSYTARGEVIDMAGGSRRWEGFFTLAPAKNNGTSPQIDAMLALLTSPGATFLMGDPRRKYPVYDPTGLIMGAAAPKFNSYGANRRDVTFKALPANYVLTRGDHLSFSYVDAAGKTQYSLHQIITQSRTANASGVTTSVEIVPPLPRGIDPVTLNVTVNFIKPCCKVTLLPGKTQYSLGRPGVVSNGQTFEFVQTRV